jgi:pimeloyl-ACP methyl ester carboxylesterase
VGGGFDELTTLICLHGSGGSGRVFLELSKRLGSSRSIYSPDLPGCGESDASPIRLSVLGYTDSIGDFLDSMRFRQIDLLGVGAGAAVAVELAIGRPKVVRKVCLLGTPGRDLEETAPGAEALLAAASSWQEDRRQLIKQPVLPLPPEAIASPDADSLARQLSAFFS